MAILLWNERESGHHTPGPRDRSQGQVSLVPEMVFGLYRTPVPPRQFLFILFFSPDGRLLPNARFWPIGLVTQGRLNREVQP